MSRRADIVREFERRVATVDTVDLVTVGRIVTYGQDDPDVLAVVMALDDDPLEQAQSLSRSLDVSVSVALAITDVNRRSKQAWFALEQVMEAVVRAIELDPTGDGQPAHQAHRRMARAGEPTPGLLTKPLERGTLEQWDLDDGETGLAATVHYECRYQVPFGEL